jgi:hypothetical protein
MASFDLEQLKIDRHLSGKPHRISGAMSLGASTDAAGGPAVTNFLNDHAAELQLGVDPAELKLVHEADTPIRKIYRYQKVIGGVPVHNAYVIMQVDNQANVNHIEVSQDAQKTAAPQAQDAAQIGAAAAEQKALQSLGANVKLRGTMPEPEKMYLPTDAGLKLSYKVLIPTQEPMHDWQIFVDADTGEILSKEDIIQHLPDGAGMVFDPNPVVTANNNALRQPTATIAAGCGYAGSALATIDTQRVSRTLKDLTFAGGVHTLDGPYARIINISAPASTIPTEATASNFNYSSSDERLGAVNVYYHIDTIQRYIQSLGITTANNRRIDADPAVSGFSAYYSPVDKSLHMGTSRPCHPDKSQEGDAIIHEYGHAIQDNQVPGWGGTNPITHRKETRAMGEGFGDTLACVFFATFGSGFQRETFEDWAYVEKGAAGLRRVDGSKVYPAAWAGEEHDDGEIWSAALWNIYRAIGGDALALVDRQAARDALLKSVIVSHHLLAVDASMPDGAEAVMRTNADLDDYRGKHLMQMLDSFHDRGLLRCDAAADLYMRDAASDTGTEPFGGSVFWESPDLWVRQAADGGTTPQDPEHGQDNYFYARIWNRGTTLARAFVVTFNVKPWAGVQFVYPGDFVPFISAAVGFNLAPGASIIVKAKWPQALIPPTGTHACLLSQVYMPTDKPSAGQHVWDKNNLAQRNMTVIDAAPDEMVMMPFQIGTLHERTAGLYAIDLIRPANAATIRVSLLASSSAETKKLFHSAEKVPNPNLTVSTAPVASVHFTDHTSAELSSRTIESAGLRLNLAAGSSIELRRPEDPVPRAPFQNMARLAEPNGQAAQIVFNEGRLARLPIYLQPSSQLKCALNIHVPKEAPLGDNIKLQVALRRSDGKTAGGITVVINVRPRN